MSGHKARRQGLDDVAGLVRTLTERMMTAYAVGSRPSEREVMAFCQGVLLLEEHRVALPCFAEDVIKRLQAQDVVNAPPPAPPSAPPTRGPSLFERMLSPFRLLRMA
ncbi:hypothetical protein [Methylobacterium brachythecii]|uniref:Uncharacterized protein n=1 Tax=Methylobacterium brachythecii TaxID=1176177 RepID=A0A7W6AKV5_9HYPH|nr:hypothetical protein [Methylobacterium brachythecii]MBB3905290.1 hypothetical protein [Methylobacterium brachythecii]GLS45936.1 hypothetical protein GCM10007884_39270 [Methylobacterium brachythecii]